MANNQNALEQIRNALRGGAQALFNATPLGQVVNTFRSQPVQQNVVRPIQQTVSQIPQRISNRISQPITIQQPGKFLSSVENNPNFISRVVLKPLASGVKTLGAATIQAPVLSLTGGMVNPEFYNPQELKQYTSGDTKERLIKFGKQYAKTVPEAAFELYGVGTGVAKTAANLTLGSLIGAGSQLVENLRTKKPITTGMKDAAEQGAITSYYMPIFNSATDALVGRVLPKIFKTIGANKIAEKLPQYTEAALSDVSEKAWETIRNTAIPWSKRAPVLYDVLKKEVTRGLLEVPVEGPGYGIVDYIKTNKPLREALVDSIVSSAITNPLFRAGGSLASNAAKQMWYGPTGELNPKAGLGLQRSIILGVTKFSKTLADHFNDPTNRAGFQKAYINFGADINGQEETMTRLEKLRLALVRDIQYADDNNHIARKNELINKLGELDQKIMEQSKLQQPKETTQINEQPNVLEKQIPTNLDASIKRGGKIEYKNGPYTIINEKSDASGSPVYYLFKNGEYITGGLDLNREIEALKIRANREKIPLSDNQDINADIKPEVIPESGIKPVTQNVEKPQTEVGINKNEYTVGDKTMSIEDITSTFNKFRDLIQKNSNSSQMILAANSRGKEIIDPKTGERTLKHNKFLEDRLSIWQKDFIDSTKQLDELARQYGFRDFNNDPRALPFFEELSKVARENEGRLQANIKPVAQESILGQETPINTATKPEQGSILDTTGAGQASQEEITRTFNRLQAEKAAGDTTQAQTPIEATVQKQAYEDAMGPSMFDYSIDEKTRKLTTDYPRTLSETDIAALRENGMNKKQINSLQKEIESAYQQKDMVDLQNAISTGEKQKAEAIQVGAEDISRHIIDLEDSISSNISPDEVDKLLKQKQDSGMSDIDYMNMLREYLAKKKIAIPELSIAEKKAITDDLLQKDKSEWTDQDKQIVADTIKQDVASVEEMPIEKIKLADSMPDSAPNDIGIKNLDELDNRIKAAIDVGDEASISYLSKQRKAFLDANRNAGLEINAKSIDDLRQEVALTKGKEYKTATKDAEAMYGQLPNIAQYKNIILNAVRTWRLNRNKSGAGDLDALTRRFPHLDEAIDELRTVLGREPQIEDLANLRFAQQNRIKVKKETPYKPKIVDGAVEGEIVYNPHPEPVGKGEIIPVKPTDEKIPYDTIHEPEPIPGQKRIGTVEQKQLNEGKMPTGGADGKTPGNNQGNRTGEEIYYKTQKDFEKAYETKKEVEVKKETLGKKSLTERILDKLAPLGKIEKKYKELTGSDLPSYLNPRTLAKLVIGGLPDQLNMVYETEYAPILREAKTLGITNELDTYLAMRRYIQNYQRAADKVNTLMAEYFRTNDVALKNEADEWVRKIRENQLNPNGITQKEAEKTIEFIRSKLGDQKFSLVESYANKYWDIMEKTLVKAGTPVSQGGYGIITPEALEELRKYSRGYAPEFVLKYIENARSAGNGVNEQMIGQDFQTYVRKWNGTEEEVDSFLAQGIRKIIGLMSHGEKNIVYQRLVDSINQIDPTMAKRVDKGFRPVGRTTHVAEIDATTVPKILNLIQSLGTSFKTKLKMRGGKLGQYSSTDDEIQRRFGTSTFTLLHELGHAIDTKFGLAKTFMENPKINSKAMRAILKMFGAEMPKDTKKRYKAAIELYRVVQREIRELADLRQLGTKGYPRKSEEKMANMFAYAITNPEEMKRIAPNAYALFERFTNSHPELGALKDIKPPTPHQGVEKFTETIFSKDVLPKASAGNRIIGFLRDGKVEYWEIPEDLARGVGYMTEKSSAAVDETLKQLLSLGKEALRAGATTFSPSFTPANLLKDMKRFMTFSKYGITDLESLITMPWSLVRGLVSSANANLFGHIDTLYKEAAMSKAMGSTYNKNITPEGILTEFEPPTMGDLMRKRLQVFELLLKINNTAEEWTKLTAFAQGLSKNKLKVGQEIPYQVAADIAKEVRDYGGSPDFSQFGTQGRNWNLLFMFLNARLQGIYADMKRYKENPGTVIRNQLIGSVLPSVALYFYNHAKSKEAEPEKTAQDPTWDIRDDMPSYVKDNNFVVVTGRKRFNQDTGKIEYERYTIPKSDADRVWGGTVDLMLDYLRKKDPQALVDIATNLFGAIYPFNVSFEKNESPVASVGYGTLSSANPIITAPFELATNFDLFKKRPIISDKMAKNIPAAQAYEYTTEAAKRAGNFLNMAPAKIDWIASRFGGSAMTDLMRTMSVAFLGEKMQSRYLPVIKRFYGWNGGQEDSDSLTDLYRKRDALGQIWNTYKGFINNNQLDKADYVLQQAPQAAYYNAFNQAVMDLSELKNAAEAVRNNPAYTDEEKQKQLIDINKMMVESMDQLNKIVDTPSTVRLPQKKLFSPEGVGAADVPLQNRSLNLIPRRTIQGVSTQEQATPYGVKIGENGMPDLKIKMKTLQPEDIQEKFYTGKEPVKIPELVEPRTQDMFTNQFTMLSEAIGDIDARIKALRLDPSIDYETKYIYQNLYEQRKNDVLKARMLFTQQYGDYWSEFLKSKEGIDWYKKEASAWYKDQGLKVPKAISNLGKSSSGSSVKIKSLKIKAPKISLKSPKIKTFKLAQPKIRSTKIYSPKVRLTKPKIKAPKI